MMLPWLLGIAIGTGGIIQGLHWRSQSPTTHIETLENQLRMVTEENEMLHRENQSLRSLAQGGGEMPVPPEFINLVEREFGLEFISNPVVHSIAREELPDRIAAAIESRFGLSGIDDRQEAYRRIGWLREGDDLLAQLTAVRAVGARGWFDDVTGDAWVTDRFEIANIPDQGALIRLLTRMLLHQHFPPPPAYPGDDAARAREALHQGAASGAEGRFLATQARTIGFMQMQQNLEVEQLMANIAPFIEGITVFPITEGRGLADTLHIQGDQALHALLRNPPQTTRAILFPAEAATDVREITLPEPPETPYLVDSAGQLGLRLWIAGLGDHGLAMDLAAAWRGDRYALVPDGPDSTKVIWDIEVEQAVHAKQLSAVALQYVAALSGHADAKPALDEVIESRDGRFLRVSRPSPTRVRFLNTHTRKRAE